MAAVGALWLDAEGVFEITRKEVDEDSIAVGQEIVAIFAGVDPETDLTTGVISSRNASRLERALAWQAAWLEAHPDVLEAMDVKGISQDGLSAEFATESAHLLAPLAARVIRRLSWKLAPLRARNRRRHMFIDVGNRDDAERDDAFTWSAMGHGGQLNPMAQRSGQTWR